jgi:hypothetical protein
MEFEGQYLTYTEYKSLGGTLGEMPFNLLEYNARKEIDSRTQNRLQGIGNNYNEVKLCVYNLITTLGSYESYTTQNKAVASESIDGYSVNYAGASTEVSTVKNKEVEDVISKDLFGLIVDGQHVLYLGI